MGRKPVENKRKPSDYPQLTFRVSGSDKVRLVSMIETVQEQLNCRRKAGDPFVNKNDVIVAALEKGLKMLKK